MALPIPVPSKIIGVGLNYGDHVKESPRILDSPFLFAKWPNALIGSGDAIVLPASARQVDYEAEVGVLIGRRIRNVSIENSLEAVAGYLCLNDVSARDQQALDGQVTRAKSADTFCPIGPELIPASEIGNPQDLRIRAILNGEIVQDSNTAAMIFTIAELIAFITTTITLLPGDLIATGTPAGVGLYQQPPRFLQPGDRITVEIDGIGSITNPVVGEFEKRAAVRAQKAQGSDDDPEPHPLRVEV